MSLIGAILGDIAGSLWEFKFGGIDPILKTDYDLFFDKETEESHFTDDTVLSIACAKAITTDFDFTKQYLEFGNKYANVGYGPRFNVWLTGSLEAYNSFGNGSAMRASFCGDAASSIKEAEVLGYFSAVPTHNHPEGIKGAITLAVCTFMAKSGMSKNDILEYAITQYPAKNYYYSPERALVSYEEEEFKFKVDCQSSVPLAIRIFYEFDDFNKMMRFINSKELDCDTIGAIAGSIFGSFYGFKFEDYKDILTSKLDEYLYDELVTILETGYNPLKIENFAQKNGDTVLKFYDDFDNLLKKDDEIVVGWTCKSVVGEEIVEETEDTNIEKVSIFGKITKIFKISS